MLSASLLFILCSMVLVCLVHNEPVIHIPIYRRGGRLARHGDANLTRLNELLTTSELKYRRSSREARLNVLVRKWYNDRDAETHMLDEAGLDGVWYAKLRVGSSQQELELDLDMLSPDLYTIMTTSEQGSKYDTFMSSTYESLSEFPHPDCRGTSEILHLPHNAFSSFQTRLSFPVCQPLKTSRHTLSKSGSKLGLGAPQPQSLARTSSSILTQLFEENRVAHRVFSLTLLDAETGVLSIGGTIAPHIEKLKIQTEVQLERLGDQTIDAARIEQEIQHKLDVAMPPGSTHQAHFRWSAAGSHASGGWHTTLIGGVWSSGVKILKNQPALLDINCPFILAPPQAAERLYESIGGAMPVEDLTIPGPRRTDQDFYTFPCLNRVNVAFEFAGWQFPIAKVGILDADTIHGPVGGLFSLGKINSTTDDQIQVGTGYCVGIVVGTHMGQKHDWQHAGMSHVWVLGEPFFRALSVAFEVGDDKGKGRRVGVRIH